MDDYVGWYTDGDGTGIERSESRLYNAAGNIKLIRSSGYGDGWLLCDEALLSGGWGNGDGYGSSSVFFGGNGRGDASRFAGEGSGEGIPPSEYREDL